MRWTEAQQQAIETRNKNILVSAAAGSGKTAVLIERIKQLVIKDKVDIDRFLITTFTNAASAEMKERLEKSIRKELEAAENDDDRNFLKRQLELLPMANISTFHRFALEIMKNHFYLTKLEPGFVIGDDIRISILKNDAVNRLFEDRFENDYDAFSNFLSKYSSDRSDDRLKKNILSIYDELRSLPHYMEWAENTCDLMNTENPADALGISEFIAEETIKSIAEAAAFYDKAADIIELAGLEELYVKAEEDARLLRQAASKAADQDLAYIESFLASVSFNRMSVKKDYREVYETIKDEVTAYRKAGKKKLDDLKKRYFSLSVEENIIELRGQYEDTKYFTELLKSFEEIFIASKREQNIVDFDDVMHYAIEILGNDAAAEEYREKFRYIFIDEFQDSNLLQEEIIKRIAGSNNLFMVGDVKQSIYRFRLAEPDIFREKYRMYSSGADEESIKIDLNSNFRSKSSVTDTVNKVFEDIMEDYDDAARLNCASEGAENGYAAQLHITDMALKNTGEDTFTDNTSAEAQLVVKLIEEYRGKLIYDASLGEMREAGYGDIAVLSRSRNVMNNMERFLNNEGIPAVGENAEDYFEAVEIRVFLDLLRIIDNTQQDISLISSMKSVVFGFSLRELAEIRIAFRGCSFYTAVKSYAADGENINLRGKISGMFKQIEYWKELKNSAPLEELVRMLVYDTGYCDYCSGLPLGKQRVMNLEMIIEKAAAFEQRESSGLYGFLEYVEAMNKAGLSAGSAKPAVDNEDAVKIMTVHKSKGLEFPFVILMGAGREIKFRGSGSPAMMHKKFSIGLPFVNRSECWHRKTLLQKAIEGCKIREELEEEIRILYVALTRAKDCLAITASVKDFQKFNETVRGTRSFLDMIYTALTESNAEIYVHNPDNVADHEHRQVSRRERYAELEQLLVRERDEAEIDEIDKLLSFEYAYRESSHVKSKYSVSELNSEYNKKESFPEREYFRHKILLNAPGFAMESRYVSAAEIGTAVHTVMERMDFKQAVAEGKAYIDDFTAALCSEGSIDEETMSYIDTKKIAAFFDDDIGRRASEAALMEKEREFILCKDIDGTETIVQGIIDCYFEEKDGLVLIDYKTGRINGKGDEDNAVERYREQIEIYREALEAACEKRVKEAYLYLLDIQKFVKVE